MEFNVAAMGKRQSFYERALQQEARRKAERTLVCPECGYQNKPGAMDIEIDTYDDARCGRCGDIWQVRLA